MLFFFWNIFYISAYVYIIITTDSYDIIVIDVIEIKYLEALNAVVYDSMIIPTNGRSEIIQQ